jgi:hypothetical protein
VSHLDVTNSPLVRSALVCLAAAAVLATCGPVKESRKNGEGCDEDLQCESGHCAESYCSPCAVDSDCSTDQRCGRTARYVGAPGGPYCVHIDAGCASTPSKCPEGFTCSTCDAGFACHDTTGECYSTATPPPPMCGSADSSRGYDAGWGPGPNTSGSTCYTCIGCPFGSTCVCGATGLVGGLACTNAGAALACFATGGVGTCRVFPGDCASNAQCVDAGTERLCNSEGHCAQCLRDTDCPQPTDGGAAGCIQGKCYGCCTQDTQCPGSAPTCVNGFCYACSSYDGGRCNPSVSDGGSDGGNDGEASDAGSTDSGTSDAGDGG